MRKIFSCIMLALCLTMQAGPAMVKAECECRESAQNLVRKVEYDAEEKEVTFEFSRRVKYNNPQVTITSPDNKETFTATVIEQDEDDLSVRVDGLVSGNTYNYSITGISPIRGTADETLTGTFKAVDLD